MAKTKLSRKSTSMSVQEQEAAIQKLDKAKPKKRALQRVTVDVPKPLYDDIKSEIEETGQTLKGFFIALAKKYFKDK
jgi:hypothetical protein